LFARDAAASIRRFAACDEFGKSPMAVTGEPSAPDDRTLRFHLTKPFPHLLSALDPQQSCGALCLSVWPPLIRFAR
jgi:peptide/nickel transport system substrate-binding protein